MCSALLAGCSGTQTVEIAQGPCVQGQSASCPCDDGSLGIRRCGSDSEYGQCLCSQQQLPTAGSNPAAGSGGAGIGAGGVDATAGAAGIAGIPAGAGGASGSSGASGFGGMTAGTGFGGVGGVGGATGGSGGVPVGTGGTPAGAGGDGSGGNSGPGREPEPGELYGDCLSIGACDAGLLCISDGSSGVPMSYCTTTCGTPNQLRCPRARDDRMATCVLGICVR